MAALDASAVARLLREFGQRTALRGGNPFRAKAYARAADNLLTLAEPLDDMIAQERLREIPGVGAAIADIIKRLHTTGSHPSLERMREEIPQGVLELLAIPGLRPDKIIKLHRELGVSSLAELEKAAREGRLAADRNGLKRRDQVIAAADENEIYAALGLAPIPPELREGSDEIARARAGGLPVLVTDDDIRGILHAHTNRSDGADSLETMAAATHRKGYGYFGIADHSRSAHYAGGLDVDEIAAQHAETARLNRKYAGHFRVFKGIESDILPDGSLDYPDEVLATFEFVVASVHSRFKLDRASQTARIVRAVANPHTTILGHMTGRQLLRRPGYEVDIEQILLACAEHGVAVEINANPWRLDLDWRWHAKALELGCMMSINPDAHTTDEIDHTHWGVEMARKGGVPATRVLNCLSLEAFTEHLGKRKAVLGGRRAGSNPRRRRAKEPAMQNRGTES